MQTCSHCVPRVFGSASNDSRKVLKRDVAMSGLAYRGAEGGSTGTRVRHALRELSIAGGGHRDVRVNGLELDQAHENHQPEVEHRRCKLLPPLRKRVANGLE